MRTEIEIDLVPIEDDGVHMFIPGRINGRKAHFLVDTGASRSVVDKDRIASFFPDRSLEMNRMEKLSTGLGTNSMESNVIVLETLSFGRKIMRKYNVVALDLTHVNQSYAMLGMRPIDGVLGGDLLFSLQAVIDYQQGKIILG